MRKCLLFKKFAGNHAHDSLQLPHGLLVEMLGVLKTLGLGRELRTHWLLENIDEQLDPGRNLVWLHQVTTDHELQSVNPGKTYLITHVENLRYEAHRCSVDRVLPETVVSQNMRLNLWEKHGNKLF